MLIEFYEFNYKLLLFLIFPIFRIIQDFTYDAYIKEDKDNNIFTTFRCYLSFIFSSIPYIIFRIRTKNKQPEKELVLNNAIKYNEEKENSEKKYRNLSQIDIEIKEM